MPNNKNYAYMYAFAKKKTRVAVDCRHLKRPLQPCGSKDESATMVTHPLSSGYNKEDERTRDDGKFLLLGPTLYSPAKPPVVGRHGRLPYHSLYINMGRMASIFQSSSSSLVPHGGLVPVSFLRILEMKGRK